MALSHYFDKQVTLPSHQAVLQSGKFHTMNFVEESTFRPLDLIAPDQIKAEFIGDYGFANADGLVFRPRLQTINVLLLSLRFAQRRGSAYAPVTRALNRE